MSGWINSDSRQYLFLISPDVADDSTPKTWYASACCPAGRLLSSLQHVGTHLPCAFSPVPPYTACKWQVQIMTDNIIPLLLDDRKVASDMSHYFLTHSQAYHSTFARNGAQAGSIQCCQSNWLLPNRHYNTCNTVLPDDSRNLSNTLIPSNTI